MPGLRVTVLVAGLLAAIFLPFTAIWNRSEADGPSYAHNLSYALVMALILLSPSVTVLLSVFLSWDGTSWPSYFYPLTCVKDS